MRIVSYRRDDGAVRFGIVDGDTVLDAGTDLARARRRAARSGRSTRVALLAPVPRPGKVVCVGRNYAEHAAETGSPVPDRAAALRQVGERGRRARASTWSTTRSPQRSTTRPSSSW